MKGQLPERRATEAPPVAGDAIAATSQAQLPAPTSKPAEQTDYTPAEWLASRRGLFEKQLQAIADLKSSLKQLGAWRLEDERALQAVESEVNDYVSNLEKDPAAHRQSVKDMCLDGPNTMVPHEPGVWSLSFFVWSVDAHLDIVVRRCKVRLAQEKLARREESPGSADDFRREMLDLLHELKFVKDKRQTIDLEKLALWLNALEAELDKSVTKAGLAERVNTIGIYSFERAVQSVTGLPNVTFVSDPWTMNTAQLLDAVKVGPPMSAFVEHKATGFKEQIDESMQYNQHRRDSFRSLTDGERDAVLAELDRL